MVRIWVRVSFLLLLFTTVSIYSQITTTDLNGVLGHTITLRCSPQQQPTDVSKFLAQAKWDGVHGEIKGDVSDTEKRVHVHFDANTLEYNLVLSELSYRDSGDYRCSLGEWGKKNYLLFVTEADIGQPVFRETIDGSVIEGIENRTMTVICSTENKGSPVNMTLSTDGRELPVAVKSAVMEDGRRQVQLEYTFEPQRNWHLASFLCSVSIQNIISTATAVLHLEVAPNSNDLSSLDITPEGASITLTCNSTGSLPKASITWHFPEGLTPEIDETDTVRLASGYISSVSVIKFLARRQDHETSIQCIIMHKALTDPITLNRRILVAFGPDELVVIGGYTENKTILTLACITSRLYPEAYIYWQVNTNNKGSSYPVFSVTSNYTQTGVGLFSTQTIVLDLLEIGPIYSVSCHAYNTWLNDESKTTFVVSLPTTSSPSKNADECHVWVVFGVCLGIIIIIIISFLIYINRRKIKNSKPFSRKSKQLNSVQRQSKVKTPITLTSSVTSNDAYYENMQTDTGASRYQNIDVPQGEMTHVYQEIGEGEEREYQRLDIQNPSDRHSYADTATTVTDTATTVADTTTTVTDTATVTDTDENAKNSEYVNS